IVARQVYKASKKVPSVDEDDLFSAGLMEAWVTLDSFDPAKSSVFRTFATFSVRGAMIDELRRGRRIRSKGRSLQFQQVNVNGLTVDSVIDLWGVPKDRA